MNLIFIMKKYNLNFKGYWLDSSKEGIPNICGIYLVYTCTYNADKETVKLIDLIYIGQSVDVNMRIKDHDRYKDFLRELKDNEILCYSVAEVEQTDLDIVENALIYAQKPKLNDDLKGAYKHEAAEFYLEGKCQFMKYLNFTIK